MKKLVTLLLAFAMVVPLVACSNTSTNNQTTDTTENTNYVAFVTDVGNIDDQSFNQYTYEGIKTYCDANGVEYNYFKPSEDSDQARLDAIDQAVSDGANVVVMAGYLFATALDEAQVKYPDVQFLAIDVGLGDLADPAQNTALITYQEEQAGYLAGYAAVTDGYTELGFLGGVAVPAVVRYGYGFVQGADAAAAELGTTANIKYWYSDSFVANDDIKAKMDSWYSEGTQVVFACGGGIVYSAISAAEANGGKIIGVDVDQSSLGDMVITSAMKALSNSVQLALEDCANNNWAWSDTYAGKETKLGAAQNCVGLPMDTSKFTTFTQDQYDTLFAALADGTLPVDNSSDTSATPAVTAITVDYQN